jgi:hypothetical protein
MPFQLCESHDLRAQEEERPSARPGSGRERLPLLAQDRGHRVGDLVQRVRLE